MKWKMSVLEEVATIERSSIQPKSIPQGASYLGLEHIESGGKILGIKPVDEGELASSKFKFTERHLLYGKLRPYLAKIALPNFSGICSTDILPILPGANLERNYLCYYLRQQSMVDYANSRATGANLPRLSPKTLAQFEIPLPPLDEQKRIAKILDAADALRTKRRAALAQLDALTQSLFLHLFGDPVTNPMGWTQSELGDLVADGDRINYGVVQPGDDHPTGKPLIRVGDFVGGDLNLTGIKFISPEIDAQYERSRLLGSELLVSCVGSIGTVCRVPKHAKGYNIARAVARVPLGSEVEREFMLYCLRSAGVQNYFASETRTVSQPTLNIGLIKTAIVTVPPLPFQKKFAVMVESIERQKTQHRAHLAELDALFASLQHRAFRGGTLIGSA